MNRLALRIFLWLWAVTAAVAVVLVATSPLLTRTRPGVLRWERRAAAVVRHRVRLLAARIERGELRPPPCPRRRHGLAGWIATPDGRVLAGPRLPRAASELAREAAASPGEVLTARSGALHLAALATTDPWGRLLVGVVAVRRPPGALDLLEPRVLLPRLALALVALGLIAAVLARRLTAPLRPLSAATRRLAAGDLAARVGEPLTRRRDEFGQLARDFDAMAGRLERLLEAQRRLLRDVSHELRSPLARLGVALELARTDDPAERDAALDRIALEAGRLDGLVGQLLTLSRLEAGAGGLQREPVALHHLMEGVVEDARYEAAGRDVGLEPHLEPVTVTGDPRLLHAAVENVVRNAVAHTAPGTTVEVRLRAAEGRAVVTVADRGPGVPEEHLEDLFRPFFRVEAHRGRGPGGTGLGLAIAAAAVRAHGGSVRAANRPAGGLEVCIELPAGDGRG